MGGRIVYPTIEHIRATIRDELSSLLGEHAENIRSLPPWVFPPAASVSFDNIAYIALPAVGVTAAIVTFTVPDGMHGVISRIANVYVGGGFTEGSQPPQLTWQILHNGVAVRNYDSIPASLGATANPSQISGIFIKEGQQIILQITNNSLVVGGAFSGGRLGGWFYPAVMEPGEQWL